MKTTTQAAADRRRLANSSNLAHLNPGPLPPLYLDAPNVLNARLGIHPNERPSLLDILDAALDIVDGCEALFRSGDPPDDTSSDNVERDDDEERASSSS
mmetsp:Transcript_11759/g.18853  ORF Transcript_11759/g.18853 Transcript_11759/m.18853 type:complete len:99 (+) Transcript_11759:121-417(+)